MAAAPYSFPYPSAATYPAPPFHPYASSYPAPPVPGFFPTPAYDPSTFVPPPPSPPPTYPYPPPVSAYAPPPGFFPALRSATYPHPTDLWSTCSMASTPSGPTFPTSTSFPACSYSAAPAAFSFPCSPAPPSEPTAPLTPAPPPIGAPFLSSTLETALLRHLDQVPNAPLTSGRPSPTPQLLDAIPTAPNRERRPPLCQASSTSVLHPATPDSMCQGGYLTEGNGAGGESISNEKFVQGHARLEQQQACDRTSFDAIQGQLTKLTSMLSQFAISLGKQSTLAHASRPEQSQHISVVREAPALVNPQVFGEMPRPNFGHGSPVIAPRYEKNCYSGYSNPIQSSCVQDGSTNLSEQHIDGLPHHYGFDNLKRQSLFLVDGSEHSYYTLPENYPLERAVPEPVCAIFDEETGGCSNEFAQVFIGTHEQQTYEEEQQKDDQPLKCFCKAPETEQSYVAISFPKVLNLCNQVGSHLQQLRDPRWDVLVVPERRKEWDPGDHTILGSTLNREIFGLPTRVLQHSCYYRVPSSQANQGTQFFWDPGILSLMEKKLGKITVPSLFHSGQAPCKLLKFSGQLVGQNQFWTQLLSCLPWCHTPYAFLEVQYCGMAIVLNCLYSEPVKQLICYSSMFSWAAMCMSTPTTVRMRLVLNSGKIAQEEEDETAWYQVLKIELKMSKTSQIWDPDIDSLLCLFICQHVHMIQLVDSSAMHACYLISAHLPPTQISAYFPSNSGFVLHQGVHENYSAKQLLLYSQKFFQTKEMDIIFITHLPP